MYHKLYKWQRLIHRVLPQYELNVACSVTDVTLEYDDLPTILVKEVEIVKYEHFFRTM